MGVAGCGGVGVVYCLDFLAALVCNLLNFLCSSFVDEYDPTIGELVTSCLVQIVFTHSP